MEVKLINQFSIQKAAKNIGQNQFNLKTRQLFLNSVQRVTKNDKQTLKYMKKTFLG